MSFISGVNEKILDRLTAPSKPPCTPGRAKALTGANYDVSWATVRSAEPDTILFDRNGVAYHATEPLATDWPAGKMAVKHSVLQS